MDGSDGRLHRAPGPPALPAASHPAWPPGLRPLDGGALLVVPERPNPDALLVFFHGAGGRATSSLELVRGLAAERGLLVLLPSSRRATWDLVQGRLGPDVVNLDTRLAEVAAAYDVRHLALGGFSDGASYALSLGLANGDLVEAVLAFSPGFAAPPATVGRPRVWVSHGTSDTVLPVELCGRRVVAQFQAAGYPVDYTEFDGGHVVTPELLAAAATSWLGG